MCVCIHVCVCVCVCVCVRQALLQRLVKQEGSIQAIASLLQIYDLKLQDGSCWLQDQLEGLVREAKRKKVAEADQAPDEGGFYGLQDAHADDSKQVPEKTMMTSTYRPHVYGTLDEDEGDTAYSTNPADFDEIKEVSDTFEPNIYGANILDQEELATPAASSNDVRFHP